MTAKFKVGENVASLDPRTSRLGAGSGSTYWIDQKEIGKLVKRVGDSQFDLCAAGDLIEAFIQAVEAAPADGYSIGSVAGTRRGDRKAVILDGLQATPGTGAIAIGDYVVCGTVVAKGTALTDYVPKVCKATVQPGTSAAVVSTVAGADTAAAVKVVLDAALVTVAANSAAQANAVKHMWKLVSASGTAVGSTGIIERV